MTARGLVLAAPASGAGKTVLTLGLLRALRDRGVAVRAGKSGPDYIDPAFHAAACGAPSVTLDAWAMPPDALRARAAAQGGEVLLVEGAMGVVDAGADGRGSAADLAAALGVPLVLLLDIAKAGQSAALTPAGLAALRPDIPVAGAILNRAGSDRHAALARDAVQAAGFRVLGSVRRDSTLSLPERHLGLVAAAETPDIEAFLDTAAARIAGAVDIDALLRTSEAVAPASDPAPALPPPGQRIAVASDIAFAFAYPHLLSDWHSRGAEIRPFSPLADEAPDPAADAVFLPGGYPELHAPKLAAAATFRAGMHTAAAAGTTIYGECGGYMALGEALIAADGRRHPMLGLLPLVASFAERRLTLGYRRLDPLSGAPWQLPLAAHEHHYATTLHEGAAQRVFTARTAEGNDLGAIGLRRGRISGSFAHLIGMRPQ